MLRTQENLCFSDKRIVGISRWTKHRGGSYLNSIYYNYWKSFSKGYRNFFNENLDVMGVAAAKKYLHWEAPKSIIKYKPCRRSQTRKFQVVPAQKIKNLTLIIYPSSELYYAIGKSLEERESVFREVIRKSIHQLMTETKLPLNWIAAVDASSSRMCGIVIIPKTIFDVEISESKPVKEVFPQHFFERDEPKSENINFIEKTFAQTFFECAAQAENFENRIDDLIEISRKYKFELPLSYYAFRYLDDEGNLLTEREKRHLSFNKRSEQFSLEITNSVKP